MAKVPKRHRWVFWDVDATALDTARDADYIVPRVLEFGRLVEVRWAIATYAGARISAATAADDELAPPRASELARG